MKDLKSLYPGVSKRNRGRGRNEGDPSGDRVDSIEGSNSLLLLLLLMLLLLLLLPAT